MSRREADFVELAKTLDQRERDRAVLESDPAYLERDEGELEQLASEARVRAQRDANVQFARAKSLLDAGHWLVALGPDGRLLSEFPACRDEQVAYSFWSQHPDAIPAMAAGPGTGLFALDVGHPRGAGVSWVYAAAYEAPPADFNAADFDEPMPRPPGWMRDHLGHPITLLEGPPLTSPRLRQSRVTIGGRALREAAQKLLVPLEQPRRQVLVWSWPVTDWRLPKAGTRLASEVVVLPFVPMEGTTVRLGDRSWRALTTLGRIQPLPDFLAEVFAGKRVPAPLPPQLQRQRVEMA